jgi:pimeloyl-ACP methyl ester carboxylesterase
MQCKKSIEKNFPMVGLEEVVLEGGPEERTITVGIWYPSFDFKGIFVPDTQPFKRIARSCRWYPVERMKPYTAVILLPGFGGDFTSLEWMIPSLISSGRVVISITHPRVCWPDIKPEIALRPWLRALDVSFVLDQLQNFLKFKKLIRFDKMGMIGFSEGGMTALWIAGAKGTFSNVVNELDNIGEKSFHEQESFKIDHNLFSLANANRSYYDSRVHSFFLMAPGFLTKKAVLGNFNEISCPIQVIYGEQDYQVLFSTYESIYKNCSYVKVHKILDCGHFDFLNLVHESATNVSKQIRGISKRGRASIHKEVLQLVTRHFNYTLES